MYAVLGATGNTGRVVADELLAMGAPTRVIVRDPSKAASFAQRGAEVFVADILDPAALAEAMRGVRGLYAMLPPSLGPDMIGVAKQVSANIASAVRAAKVQKVVQLSSVGAQHERGTGPILTNRNLELALRPATSSLVALRPPYFMENFGESLAMLGEGKLITFSSPTRAIPMIATDDIGRIAARLLLEEPRGHELVALEGPRTYSPEDAAAELSSLLGRKIEVLHVPNEQIVPTLARLGVPEPLADLYREMYQAIDEGRAVQEGGIARVERGSVTLRTVLERLVPG